MPLRTRLSQKTLLDLLHYDGRNGLLTWRVDRGRNAKAGDEAGTIRPDGMISVVVAGRTYLAHRLAWLYKTGAFPEGRLTFRDGDPGNLKWSNLVEETRALAQTPAAVYQRERRARLRGPEIAE